MDHYLILGAKEKDHVYLFEQMDDALVASKEMEFSTTKTDGSEVIDTFRFVNEIALNKSHPDLLVNMLEYWQVDADGKELHFTWVTDLPLSDDNTYKIMFAVCRSCPLEH